MNKRFRDKVLVEIIDDLEGFVIFLFLTNIEFLIIE
jgi:hypothetical protein